MKNWQLDVRVMNSLFHPVN